MSYSGPTFGDLKTMVGGIVRRQLAAEPLGNDLLELSLRAGMRTIEDSSDGWHVLQSTVTTYDDATPLQTTGGSRLVPIPSRYKDGARLYYLSGSSRLPIPCSVLGKPVTMEWIWENHPDPAVTSDTPQAMCVHGESFVIVPTPTSSYGLSLEARFYLPDLSASEDRNWFTMHLTAPLVQLAVGHALMLLHEEEWAKDYLALGQQSLQLSIGAEATEQARRTPQQVGQEPV